MNERSKHECEEIRKAYRASLELHVDAVGELRWTLRDPFNSGVGYLKFCPFCGERLELAKPILSASETAYRIAPGVMQVQDEKWGPFHAPH